MIALRPPRWRKAARSSSRSPRKTSTRTWDHSQRNSAARPRMNTASPSSAAIGAFIILTLAWALLTLAWARAIRLMTSCFLLRVANDVSRSLAAKAMTDFKVKAVLGVGAFGKVLLCRHPDSKGVFAVKQLSKAQIIAAQLQHHVRQERYERESLSMYTYVFSPTAFPMFTLKIAYFLNSLTCVPVYPPRVSVEQTQGRHEGLRHSVFGPARRDVSGPRKYILFLV